ncbi:transcriptional regulator with XRE-family HTH domain [Novosphingobium sp. SG751A]|uniref:helix-turn-helix domain-containing protein n=1 Tax=Novosphingobium sp. SG751A TaxID=2587000 RepID=UPI0015546473|nr:helix-turn-helix transcriptional regulator [Novosphingobium sp. SG751A]NOW44081.1 transcriptional regulator with XRE-family HTH domain [Novosphingobium sp. SG751A]
MGKAFDIERFRTRLTYLMEMHGLAPKSLSIRAGLGETAVRDIFAPKRKDVHIGTAVKLADYFGVTLEEMLGREDDEKVETFEIYRNLDPQMQQQAKIFINTLRETSAKFKHKGDEDDQPEPA